MPVQPNAASWTKQYASAATADWSTNPATYIQVVGAGTVVATNEDGTTATMICAGGEVFPGVFTALVSTNATYVNAGNGDAPPAIPIVGTEASAATSLTTAVSANLSTTTSADTSLTSRFSTQDSALTSSDVSLAARDSALTSVDTSLTTRFSTADSANLSATVSADTSLVSRLSAVDSANLSTALSAAASAALA